MFADAHYPSTLSAAELDDYLERGWFRMGQVIFTTNFLNLKDQFYSAIWLRVVLGEFRPDKGQQKLIKRNDTFSVEVKKASITEEKEILYTKYKQCVTFEASASLNTLMFGRSEHNIYNTYEVCVYDAGKLIAAGFFDLGSNCAAGITSFYDPDYKKHSLGRYLICLKINYCKELGLQYFYPGYFVPGYPHFDYKLSIGTAALQYLDLVTGRWLPIDRFSPAQAPLHVMRQKLLELQQLLLQADIQSKMFTYGYLDAKLLPELKEAILFDYPLFLYGHDLATDEINPMIIYDVRDEHYHVIKCASIWVSNAQSNADDFYVSHLLIIEEDRFFTRDARSVVAMLATEKQARLR